MVKLNNKSSIECAPMKFNLDYKLSVLTWYKE